KGKLNETALKEAIRALVNRHDALRAKFVHEGQLQKFVPHLDLALPTADLTSLGAEERAARVKQMITDDAHTPFHLAEGPMVRVQLLKLTSDSWQLIFTSHHIVCDGWSTNVLLDELSRLYNGELAGQSVQLESHMTFSEYAREQERHFRGQEGTENEAYWTRQFAHLPPLLNLPIDRP